jgi:3-oxoacyl-[acyl-carrier protein] reductase
MNRVMGRVALVTGASRGIGRSIALGLAREGADIAVNYRVSADLASEVVNAVRALRREAVAVQADVSRAVEVARMVEQVVERFGRIDILVNNAGVTSFFPLLEIMEEEFDRMLAINLKGVFLCTQAVAPHMIRSGWGKIVNVSSVSGIVGPPDQAHYCASKGGVNTFTKAAATELRKHNITVNAICPGGTETDMLTQHLAAQGFTFDPPGSMGVTRKLGRPEDMVGAAVFLSCDESAWLTGALIVIDGGNLAR